MLHRTRAGVDVPGTGVKRAAQPFVFGKLLCTMLLATGFLTQVGPGHAQTQAVVPRGENFIVATGSAIASGGRPGVASDGLNFLTTWRHNDSRLIACARVSRDGVALDTTPIVVGSGAQVPSVAFDGTNFLLVWVEASEVRAARVSSAGVLVDMTPLVITSGGSARERPITVAFDGNNYLVAWRTNGDVIRGARIAKSGAALDAPAGFDIGIGFYPWAAAGGGKFVVAWHANGPSGLDVYAARVAADGTVVDPGGFVIADLPDDQDHVSIASSGANFLVAWHDWRDTDNQGNGQAYGARLAADGRTILDSPPIRIAEMALWQVPVEVAFDGIDYFVAWHAANSAKFRLTDSYGRRVSTAGTLPDEKPIPIGTAYAHQWGPTLAADANRLLVTVYDHRTGSACAGGCIQAQLLERTNVTPAVTLAGSPPFGPSAWSVEATTVSNPLYAIAAVGGGRAFTSGGGEFGSSILERVGGAWQAVYASNQRVYAMWAGGVEPRVRSVGWCWNTEHFNGTQWTSGNCGGLGPPSDPYQIGLGVWGFGDGSYTTVGTEGAFRHDGNLPIRGSTGTAVTLFAVWGSSPTNIYAVGELGRIMHFDGANWTRVANVPTVQTLNAIWGSSSDNIFVAGDFGTILHFDGASWTNQATPTMAHLLGITGTATNRLYAVGSRGAILRFDGSQWNAEPSGTTAWLYAVASADNKVWAVGDAGLILKKDLPGAAAVSVSLASSLNPAPVGVSITLTTSISGASGAATGSVVFKAGAVTISGCEAIAVSAGLAVCATSQLAGGIHAITAAYLGSAIYEDRVSLPLLQQVRDVPAAPVIGTAIAGDGEATIVFAAPASNGGSPVTTYTATCNPGAISTSGSASPITVAPLANNTMHGCVVTATNAVGTSLPSASIDVTPSASAAVTLIRARSRKVHGSAGPFDLRIDITASAGGAVTIEPRDAGTGHLLVLQFNVPITDTAIDVQVTPSGMVSALATGKDVNVTLIGVPDQQGITVSLNNLNGNGASVPVSMGLLQGDVNQTRAINAVDISVVKARSGQVLTEANFMLDVNMSGAIDSRDVSMVKGRAGRSMP